MVPQMVIMPLSWILLRDWGADLFSLSFLLPSHDVNSLFFMCFPAKPEAKTSEYSQLWLERLSNAQINLSSF